MKLEGATEEKRPSRRTYSDPKAKLAYVADDDVEMRELVRKLLCRAGYRVVALPTGGALVENLSATALGSERPALLVTDLRMPGYTGIEIIQGIRDFGWNIPIILITAFAEPEVLEHARSLGPTYVLEKPFDPYALLELVKSLEAESQACTPVRAHAPRR